MILTAHASYMTRCLELAGQAKAKGKTAVGSLIVCQNEIIAEGAEGSKALPSMLAHAEVIAIINAVEFLGTRDLSKCILYTTVEPCLMCSFLIRETRIKQVVYGVAASHIGGYTSGYPILTAGDVARWTSIPEVTTGILENACHQLLAK